MLLLVFELASLANRRINLAARLGEGLSRLHVEGLFANGFFDAMAALENGDETGTENKEGEGPRVWGAAIGLSARRFSTSGGRREVQERELEERDRRIRELEGRISRLEATRGRDVPAPLGSWERKGRW